MSAKMINVRKYIYAVQAEMHLYSLQNQTIPVLVLCKKPPDKWDLNVWMNTQTAKLSYEAIVDST